MQQLKRSLPKRGSRIQRILPTTLRRQPVIPLGIWSEDEDIVVREEEDDVDISEKKMKGVLNREFPGKFRTWRNTQAVVDWSKVEDKVH